MLPVVFRIPVRAPVATSSARRLPWEIREKQLSCRFLVSSVLCQATHSHQQQEWHSLAQRVVEEELIPLQKIVGAAGKHTKSLSDTPAFSQGGPAASGEPDAESVRLGSTFRRASEVEQDPPAVLKATMSLTCLPKGHLVEPKVLHHTRRDSYGLCLKEPFHPTPPASAGSSWAASRAD